MIAVPKVISSATMTILTMTHAFMALELQNMNVVPDRRPPLGGFFLVDYRTVKKPEALRGTVIEADDPGLTDGVDTAVGLDTEACKPDAQLDIRYRDGNTYVSLAVDNAKGERVPEQHWMFTGYISPMDCRTNWKAAQRADA